ncbi:class I SAM-dependent methyltransferase [Mycolicibacterium monacense]|uniref:Putative S-adenosyl-L-methionine-dependent methyltransferase Mjls_1071 n=2 Tax=Mycobacteriaceae TaxID=1762 RepID=Y1071_MYCSJ|nr:class I SAM-dependent methyltransferase [Mycolicibacterium monacense]A3PVF1.1 RecName: Full=Putative S-adenosyl-L-methionine-dependent methyltransferase Mjls_1071 [Mycobacterium sp. JLS]MDA4101288.1 S-adenosyl-L-methionine-dependent methyltransferase [Mycolicibacterium monacense DSM 44395]OBB62635.1 SAM-dependent methyltransferase [Mycolicibacterium monacense]ORB20751.1 SAM-dependent methyltransferase [Mycolicibacterium monacense DSM 44395]QHP84880.1 class I SAM-dependent methyltransferase 
MARAEGDSWDVASSVGATAAMVAAGRAVATRDPRGLIDDPYAAPLVRAVGIEFFTKVADGEFDMTELDPSSAAEMQARIDEMALRTRFFDDYFLASTAGGIRQVVILASGLDSRAYRLPWPDGTVVYEIDQPAVIDFKTSTLAGIGAEPTAERRTVAIDLREDWPAALRAAGFDSAAPTAWCAEGLLIYLPPEAQDLLFDNVTALSATGSTVATEYVPGILNFDAEKARAASAQMRERGLDLDMPSLVYHGERKHVMEYLTSLGWTMAGLPRTDLFAKHGVPMVAHDNDPLGEIVYVSGTYQNR